MAVKTVTASTTNSKELKKLGLRKGQKIGDAKVTGVSYIYSNIETMDYDGKGLDKGARYIMVDLSNEQRVDWYTLPYSDTETADNQAIQREWNNARILGNSKWTTWDKSTILEAGKDGWTITELK